MRRIGRFIIDAKQPALQRIHPLILITICDGTLNKAPV
jgi:hypothetical protein